MGREQSRRVEICKRGLLAFGLDGIKCIKNLLEFRIFTTNLQENSNNSEPIGLVNSLAETLIFGVPMHQMKLSRIFDVCYSMLRALVIRSSPMEMELLEPEFP